MSYTESPNVFAIEYALSREGTFPFMYECIVLRFTPERSASHLIIIPRSSSISFSLHSTSPTSPRIFRQRTCRILWRSVGGFGEKKIPPEGRRRTLVCLDLTYNWVFPVVLCDLRDTAPREVFPNDLSSRFRPKLHLHHVII